MHSFDCLVLRTGIPDASPSAWLVLLQVSVTIRFFLHRESSLGGSQYKVFSPMPNSWFRIRDGSSRKCVVNQKEKKKKDK